MGNGNIHLVSFISHEASLGLLGNDLNRITQHAGELDERGDMMELYGPYRVKNAVSRESPNDNVEMQLKDEMSAVKHKLSHAPDAHRTDTYRRPSETWTWMMPLHYPPSPPRPARP